MYEHIFVSATSVAGGYLSGITEGVATVGLIWTVYPFTIFIAFVLGEKFILKIIFENICSIILLHTPYQSFLCFLTPLHIQLLLTKEGCMNPPYLVSILK